MTASRKPLAAVDSCAVLELFLTSDQEKALAVSGIFEDGEFQVVLPSFVGVEVIATPAMRLGAQNPPVINSEIQAARAFLDNCGAIVAELDARTMQLAGELGTELLLKPADAAVLATSISSGCEKLFTYDKQLIRASAALPQIKVEEPPPPLTLIPSTP